MKLEKYRYCITNPVVRKKLTNLINERDILIEGIESYNKKYLEICALIEKEIKSTTPK